MPRPPIEPSKLALLLETASSVYSQPLFHIVKAVRGQAFAEECAICSAWLCDQLAQDGAPPHEAHRVSYLYGCGFSKAADPWPVAIDLLRRWRMGLPLTATAEAN